MRREMKGKGNRDRRGGGDGEEEIFATCSL